MDIENLLGRYCSHLIAVERRALLTAATYRTEIQRFLEYLELKKLEPENVTPSVLSDYLDCRKCEDKIDSRSASKAISSLRSFFRFLSVIGVRKDNPALVLELPLQRNRLPQNVESEKFEQLLSSIDTSNPLGLRNRTIYELLYSAGLRISEAVGLNVKDLNFTEGLAKVRGKGRKERIVLFGPEAAIWLRRYLDEARPLLAEGSPQGRQTHALFIGRNGKRLSRKSIWRNYSRNAIQVGISSRLHNIRHSYATEMLANGADTRSLQVLMGHASLTSTQVYTHVELTKLRENYRKFMPSLKEFRTKEDQPEPVEVT